MISIGDTIFVIKISPFNGTLRIPARVISVSDNSFNVEAISGAFDTEGHDRMALQKRAKGKTWE